MVFLKRKHLIIFMVIVAILIFLFILYKNNIYENFDGEIIVSKLDNAAGFFSQFFFLLNHYIYCKKNKQNFKINTDEWMYSSKNGWTDYFESTELIYDPDISKERTIGHLQILGEYSIKEYQTVIPEIYRYNKQTQKLIDTTKQQLKLIKGEYDSIYIRRGDKLVSGESVLIPEETYINILLNKNPNCKMIYLQTDDYNCFIKLQQYITDKKLNIQIRTLCDKNSVGSISHNLDYPSNEKNTEKNTEDYVSTIIDKLKKTKTIKDMNKDEIYKHTMELIIGIDLVINSNICITDYQSNVSRFIKLSHNNPNNVYDVNNMNEDIDYEKKVCPAYSF